MTKIRDDVNNTHIAMRLGTLQEHLRVSSLIHEFESNGHMLARVNPLESTNSLRHLVHGKSLRVTSLTKEHYGFTDADLDLNFELSSKSQLKSLRDILLHLHNSFAGSKGLEFSHLSNPLKKKFVKKMFMNTEEHSQEKKLNILKSIANAQAFEEFCSNKFSAATHFSLEGGEALIPGLEQVLETASGLGVEAVEMGMAHRGRLNVLKNVLQVPFASLLDRFESYLDDDAGLPNNSDDVRYHLGASTERKFVGLDGTERKIRIALAANPSHLEAVNSVVLGKARARQFLMSTGERFHEGLNFDVSPTEEARRAVMPLLLHGDASFFIGSVRESMGFSQLKDYTTGGTIHVIVNNQIGFTTLPKQAHSSTYCSDVAKSVGAPIFHVNGDEPDEVVRVCRAAVEYRQKFLSDVVVNFWCFRRKGHNQSDAPEVTQPLMYSIIKSKPPVSRTYAASIDPTNESLADDALNEARKEIEDNVKMQLGQVVQSRLPLNRAQSQTPDVEEDVRLTWNERQVKDIPEHTVQVLDAFGFTDETKSGVRLDLLKQIGQAMFTLPPSSVFQAHTKVMGIFDKRLKSVSGESNGDGKTKDPLVRWDAAEQLALGSLMVDGVDCRLSGQDVERGTFNQRHAALYSINKTTGEEIQYYPWTGLTKAKLTGVTRPENQRMGVLNVCNSPLSEESVLAFEHGYSLYSFSVLGMWEAQFGDFANCAQIVIDTFIASGEEKWVRQSGIVMMLPHGFDGQGPDHSSAYMERFLSLVSESDDPAWEVLFGEEDDPRLARKSVNMHVINPTTPAQLFHSLRRHMISPFRKPLVMFTPKFLLHHSPCASRLSEFGPEKGSFKVVIGEENKPKRWKRVVFCTGKIYYHLAEERDRRGLNDTVALVRVEQLCPFPFAAVRRELKQLFANSAEDVQVVWAQEEPKNRGAWMFMSSRLNWVLRSFPKQRGVAQNASYLGRPPSASPATGSYVKHRRELQKLMDKVLTFEE